MGSYCFKPRIARTKQLNMWAVLGLSFGLYSYIEAHIWDQMIRIRPVRVEDAEGVIGVLNPLIQSRDYFVYDTVITEIYTLTLLNAFFFFLKDPAPPELSPFPLLGPLQI